jgi:hypothetical protein
MAITVFTPRGKRVVQALTQSVESLHCVYCDWSRQETSPNDHTLIPCTGVEQFMLPACRVNSTQSLPYSWKVDALDSRAHSPKIGTGVTRVSSPRVPMPILPGSPLTSLGAMTDTNAAGAMPAEHRPASRVYTGSMQLRSAAGQRLAAAASNAVPLNQPTLAPVRG